MLDTNNYQDIVKQYEGDPAYQMSIFPTPEFPSRVRFDKVVVKKGGSIVVAQCEMVGDYSLFPGEETSETSVDGKMRAPSDHLGIMTQLSL